MASGSAQPTLSLCMIAKNEEAFIPQSINSVKGIVDEIIVVDTGSSDGTKQLAKTLGAKVYDFAWTNDFAAAHNFAVSQATKDWVLVLDADESISAKDHALLLKLIQNQKVDGYVLEQRTYSTQVESHNWHICDGAYEEEKKFAGYFPSFLVRIFRNHKGYHFMHRNHDLVEPSIREKKGVIQKSPLVIHHFAKIKGSEFFEDKIDQYLTMGLEQIKEDPKNPRPHYEVGLIYLTKNDLNKAEKYLKQVVQLDSLYKTAMTQLGIIEVKRKNYQKAAKIFQESIQKKPKQDLAYLYLGELMMSIKKFDKAAMLFKEAGMHNPKNFRAHQKYCTAMVLKGKPDISLKVMLKILGKNKQIIDAYNSLGEIYFAKKQYDKARQVLEKGIALAEKQDNVSKKILLTINLAEAHRHLGNKEKARTLLQGTLPLKPKNVEAIQQRIRQLQG